MFCEVGDRAVGDLRVGSGHDREVAWFHIEVEGGTLIDRIDDVPPEDRTHR